MARARAEGSRSGPAGSAAKEDRASAKGEGGVVGGGGAHALGGGRGHALGGREAEDEEIGVYACGSDVC